MLLGLLQSYEAEGQYARVLQMLASSPADGAEYQALKSRCEFAISRQQGDAIDKALKAGNREEAAKALAELRAAVGETTIVKAFAALIGPVETTAESQPKPDVAKPAEVKPQPEATPKVATRQETVADNTPEEPLEAQLPPPLARQQIPLHRKHQFRGRTGLRTCRKERTLHAP